ncbi:2955_t:CDS:2 [Entrophospora sp. SA101]|nr:2955_t:CDS:2 [Entrophospora sp. SA101]
MLEILNKNLKIQSTTTTQDDQNYHYDVLIKAGEKLQELFAHSRILRERSPYFEAAFIYTNKVDLSQFNGPQVLEILVASDELLILGDLIYPAQDHLIQNEAKWIEQNLLTHELWNYHKYPKIELDHILPIRSPILNNFESKLLNRDQINKFKKFIYKNDDFGQLLPNNFNKDTSRLKFNLRLLIRGSRDGLSPKKFHHLCDNKGPNIVIMKVKKSQQIIGGYNPVGWFGKGIKWRYTKKGFLFSFGTPEKQEFLISRPKQRSSHYTIYDDPNAGPSFGINDLRFYKQFSSESNNCCAIPTVFETKIINETEFLVEDYEVYQIYLDSDLKNLGI